MSKPQHLVENDYDSPTSSVDRPAGYDDNDVFGHEENHDIKYKTLSWQAVAFIMIAEIVSNGMLSLPSALAGVGMVPGIILIIFLGVFATYTSWLLVEFKLRHPEVHSMGDAGYIMFGPVGREVMSLGTCIFAIFAAGGQMLVGAQAFSSLSGYSVCSVTYTAIWAIMTLLLSVPRTFGAGLNWLSAGSCASIFIAGLIGMIGAGVEPTPDRQVDATVSSDFTTAFLAVTNPVFAYAGHFMFFILVSEMKQPKHAMKAAYTLQGFATSYYTIFAAVTYAFLGSKVLSPSFLSLSPQWQKAAFGICLPNLLIAGSLYVHTAAKVLFVRIFRNSHHKHDHTVLGWSVWLALCFFGAAIAFVLATGIPIFNYLIAIAASLFAAWFTYGIAGMFYLHDHGLKKSVFHSTMSILTIAAGGFICVAGMYVSVQGIRAMYDAGLSTPFSCAVDPNAATS